MNFNFIKLNPSQELKLAQKESERLVEKQKVPDSFIHLQPMACILPETFTKEDFLSIKSFRVYKSFISEGMILAFPCRIEYEKGFLDTSIPFAVKTHDGVFNLQEVFFKAKELPYTFTEVLFSQENIHFIPTSFKMCRARIEENSWALYDDVWKKLK